MSTISTVVNFLVFSNSCQVGEISLKGEVEVKEVTEEIIIPLWMTEKVSEMVLSEHASTPLQIIATYRVGDKVNVLVK